MHALLQILLGLHRTKTKVVKTNLAFVSSHQFNRNQTSLPSPPYRKTWISTANPNLTIHYYVVVFGETISNGHPCITQNAVFFISAVIELWKNNRANRGYPVTLL